jgi:malonyl-CoA O-methyltransferase
MNERNPQAIASRFSLAAHQYEDAALIQRQAAGLLDDWIAQIQDEHDLPAPQRIAEIGCGTGLLTRLLLARYPSVQFHISDLAPAMVEHCRTRFGNAENLHYLVCDGRDVRFEPEPDWIVSAMCFQWFDALPAVLGQHFAHSDMLAFSVMLDGSFSAWRAAHARIGCPDGLRPCPDFDVLLRFCQTLGAAGVHAQRISLNESHEDGLSFVRSLRAIGADLPHAQHRPVNLRRVLQQLDAPFEANYEIGFFCIRK